MNKNDPLNSESTSPSFTQRLAKKVDIYKAVLYAMLTQRSFTMPEELRHDYKLGQALECIRQRWPETFAPGEDIERPIFIFSAGWRAGSTLLQRLVVSSKEVVIWGEPLGEAAIIPRLAYSVACISKIWPYDNWFDPEANLSDLSNQWIANLTPEITFLRSSHRSLLQEWLRTPVEQRFGIKRWGLKEVRLTIHHAQYLKWLFPNACFLFIYRNPFDAYTSWKANRWISFWPRYFTRSPIAFTRHWKYLLQGFLDGYKGVNGLMIKFEDMVSKKIELESIAEHIGVKKLDSSIFDRKIASPKLKNNLVRKRLTFYDRFMISVIGGKLLSQLGYK